MQNLENLADQSGKNLSEPTSGSEVIQFPVDGNLAVLSEPNRFLEEKIINDIDELKVEYANNHPFKHIVIDNFFNHEFLKSIVKEFPDLNKVDKSEKISYQTANEKKLAGKGEANFGPLTRQLMHYLNSEPFLDWLQELTGIEELLIPDPHFLGGGFHEIKPGGFLKLHTDFNKHFKTGLDRRINLLVYLNEEWDESYHGDLQLWTSDMSECAKSVLPKFNRVVIFNTDDYSYHGLPDPVTCPEGMSRKSLALYYFSNGRPEHEINRDNTTTAFRKRPGKDKKSFGEIAALFIPPIVSKIAYRLGGKKYE